MYLILWFGIEIFVGFLIVRGVGVVVLEGGVDVVGVLLFLFVLLVLVFLV